MSVDASRPGRWRVLFTKVLSILRWLTSREQLAKSSKSASPGRSSSADFVRWLVARDELPRLKSQNEPRSMSTLESLLSPDELPDPSPDDPAASQDSLLRHFLRRETIQTLDKEKLDGVG